MQFVFKSHSLMLYLHSSISKKFKMKAMARIKRDEKGIHAKTDTNQTNGGDGNKIYINVVLW